MKNLIIQKIVNYKLKTAQQAYCCAGHGGHGNGR